jgi:hypothetical protein
MKRRRTEETHEFYGEMTEDVYDNNVVLNYLHKQPFLSSVIQSSIAVDDMHDIEVDEFFNEEDPYTILEFIITSLENFIAKHLLKEHLRSSITVTYPDKWTYYKTGDLLYVFISVPFAHERFYCIFIQMVIDFFLSHLRNYVYSQNLNVFYDRVENVFIVKDTAPTQRIFTPYIKNLGVPEEEFYNR